MTILFAEHTQPETLDSEAGSLKVGGGQERVLWTREAEVALSHETALHGNAVRTISERIAEKDEQDRVSRVHVKRARRSLSGEPPRWNQSRWVVGGLCAGAGLDGLFAQIRESASVSEPATLMCVALLLGGSVLISAQIQENGTARRD